MTAYSVATYGEIAGGVAVKAGTYPIRIVQATCATTGSAARVYVYRYTGSSISGGSVLDVNPLRHGAPASSATSRYGSLTISGTQTLCWVGNHGDGWHNETNGSVTTTYHDGTTLNFSPPYAFVVKPGNVFQITWPEANAGGIVYGTGTIFFEEMRPLQGCY